VDHLRKPISWPTWLFARPEFQLAGTKRLRNEVCHLFNAKVIITIVQKQRKDRLSTSVVPIPLMEIIKRHANKRNEKPKLAILCEPLSLERQHIFH
jgi:hypothetical protein